MNVVYIESAKWGGANLFCIFGGDFAYKTNLKGSKMRLNVHNVHTYTSGRGFGAETAIIGVLLHIMYVCMGLNENFLAWLLFGMYVNEHWFLNVH